MKLIPSTLTFKRICLLVLVLGCAGPLLQAQTAGDPAASDPTAVQPSSPDLQPPPTSAPAQYQPASTALLITGIVCTAGGAVLLVYGAQFKDAYNSSYAAWLANPNSSTLATRDAASQQYLLPLVGGLALSATGIICAIVGLSNGMGGESYQPIIPNVDKDAPVKTGLYLFINPSSVGLALR